MSRIMLSALLMIALAAPLSAQTDPAKRYDGSQTAPPPTRVSLPSAVSRPRVTSQVHIGERAPDFELESAEGEKVKISSLRGQWVALFFVSRREGLLALDEVQRTLSPRGIRVVAVCAEKIHSLRHYLADHPSSALTLGDPMSDVAALYGVFDSTRNATLPGLVVIDIEGRVRSALMGQTLPPKDAARIVQYAVNGL